MVGHQSVGPDLDVALEGLFGQEVAIDLLIPVLEEDRLAPVAPLSHVVRKAWGDDPGVAGHRRKVAESEQKGSRYPVAVFPRSARYPVSAFFRGPPPLPQAKDLVRGISCPAKGDRGSVAWLSRIGTAQGANRARTNLLKPLIAFFVVSRFSCPFLVNLFPKAQSIGLRKCRHLGVGMCFQLAQER
jgi:hypothetical protein